MQASQRTSWTLQELYAAVEDLVEHHKAAWLYQQLERELTAHISTLRDKLRSCVQLSDADYLAAFNATWATFSQHMVCHCTSPSSRRC